MVEVVEVVEGDSKKRGMTFWDLFTTLILNSLGFKPQAIEKYISD